MQYIGFATGELHLAGDAPSRVSGQVKPHLEKPGAQCATATTTTIQACRCDLAFYLQKPASCNVVLHELHCGIVSVQLIQQQHCPDCINTDLRIPVCSTSLYEMHVDVLGSARLHHNSAVACVSMRNSVSSTSCCGLWFKV